MKIKNFTKAAKRIKKAVKNKEKIILYGDADLDGISSVVILKETINNLGGKIFSIYIANRKEEGYGISKKALDELKDSSPALFICLDLGISNFEEIDLANREGFEVMIIDHHQPLDKLPEASIIVTPKQKGDNSVFKEYANVGLVFKLAEEILGEDFSEILKNSFLELAALGTIADMMPETGENKKIIERGLSNLEKTYRPGLRVFFENPRLKREYQIKGIRMMASLIIGALNSGKNEGHLHQTYRLLTSSSVDEARKILEELLERNYQKKLRIREITEEVKKRISTKIDNPVFFEGDPYWPLLFLGASATRVCKEYEKPVFLYRKGKKESQGSVRSIKGLNSVEAMKSCSQFLKTYGGHPRASGFTVPNENLEDFKNCLLKYFKDNE